MTNFPKQGLSILLLLFLSALSLGHRWEDSLSHLMLINAFCYLVFKKKGHKKPDQAPSATWIKNH